MWKISQETCVAAAHQLRFAPGEGERLHGHNWRIKAVLRARELDASGFVVDFNHLGAVLRALVEPYEHVFLNEISPFDNLTRPRRTSRASSPTISPRSSTMDAFASPASRSGRTIVLRDLLPAPAAD